MENNISFDNFIYKNALKVILGINVGYFMKNAFIKENSYTIMNKAE